MNRGSNTFYADDLKKWDNEVQIDKMWVLARPHGKSGFFYRLRLAWHVFRGKADALYWFRQ